MLQKKSAIQERAAIESGDARQALRKARQKAKEKAPQTASAKAAAPVKSAAASRAIRWIDLIDYTARN